MTSNNIWLEVRKDNGAILSYFLDKPEAPPATVDYIQATQDELLYLNALEDFIFSAGMVATLDDLASHRERLQAAKKKAATPPTGSNKTHSQKSVESATKSSGDKQKTTKRLTKSDFMAGFKQIDRSRK